MKKHVNIRLSGRVQNVGFRYAAMLTAEKYDIKGFIKNEPDGTVYIEAEGKEPQINHFIAWCHDGPASARVDNIETSEAPVDNLERFRIA